MLTSRTTKALIILGIFVLALGLDRGIETGAVRPGRHVGPLLDFPGGLLVLTVPMTKQLGLKGRTLELFVRSLWLLYIGLSTGIVFVHKNSRVIGLSLVLLLMLSLNLLGIWIFAVLQGIG